MSQPNYALVYCKLFRHITCVRWRTRERKSSSNAFENFPFRPDYIIKEENSRKLSIRRSELRRHEAKVRSRNCLSSIYFYESSQLMLPVSRSMLKSCKRTKRRVKVSSIKVSWNPLATWHVAIGRRQGEHSDLVLSALRIILSMVKLKKKVFMAWKNCGKEKINNQLAGKENFSLRIKTRNSN